MSLNIQIGKKAPDFTGVDQNGHKIKLSNYRGQFIALYFYPRDMTPTCTVQACNLRDNFQLLQKHNIQVIGVSADDINNHKKFETKNNLPFPLVADTSTDISQKYGVWQLKKFMGKTFMGIVRTTFIIDPSGTLVGIISKPKSKEHAQEIIALIQHLS